MPSGAPRAAFQETSQARRALSIPLPANGEETRTMLDPVFGLPVHALVVHATVVIVPTAAISVLLAAVWPRFRRWAGWGPGALAVVALVLTPISTSSGEE